MLQVDNLQKALQTAFEEVLPSAFKEVVKAMVPEKSTDGESKAEAVETMVKELVSEDLSTRLAYAIDSYIKNADIYGTIITTGSPFTQTAMINGSSPIINGKVPNTLGIK